MSGLHPDVRAAIKARKERLAAEAALATLCRRKGITAESPVGPSPATTVPQPAAADLPDEIPPGLVESLVEQEALLRRGHQPPSPDPIDPTPEQIREACLAIQATWSRQELRRRELGVIPDKRGKRYLVAPESGRTTTRIVRCVGGVD